MFWVILVVFSTLSIIGFLTWIIAANTDKIGTAVMTIMGVIVSAVISFAVCYLVSYSLNTDVEGQINSYIVRKETIEDSMQNEQLSGLERIELLKQTNELNNWLAITKVDMSKWTAFWCYKDVKIKINSLEAISLKGEK